MGLFHASLGSDRVAIAVDTPPGTKYVHRLHTRHRCPGEKGAALHKAKETSVG
jgi:hypothetical protein